MQWLNNNGVGLCWHEEGKMHGRPVLFLNSLGTDFRVWDPIVKRLPPELRIVRCDTRGHGLSDAPDGAYSVEMLADDCTALLDTLDLKDVTVVGISLGGMLAQHLAVRRPKRVTALVLSNTAVRMGTTELWKERAAAIEAHGLASIADGVLARWFSSGFLQRADVSLWRNMLCRTPVAGYAGCCAALAQADVSEQCASITVPTLVIGGSVDGASPPEAVQDLAARIQKAEYVELEAGHLPCVETPDLFAQHLVRFLRRRHDE